VNDLTRPLRIGPGKRHDIPAYYVSENNNRWLYYATRSHLFRLAVHARALIKGYLRGDVVDAAGSYYTVNRKKRQDAKEIPLPEVLQGVPRFYKENVKAISDLLARKKLRGVYLMQPALWKEHMPPEEEALLWPTPGRSDFRYPPSSLMKALEGFNDVLRREAARSASVDLIDLSALLPKDTSVFYDDVHYNDQGARLIADILFEYFTEKL
jgi:hypothetical protein